MKSMVLVLEIMLESTSAIELEIVREQMLEALLESALD